jgi:uncharacterized protein YjiS (DUF1127 family)
MTAITFSAGHARPSRFRTVLGALNTFFAGIQEGREIWTRYETLTRMSDAQLARHGLRREEVPQAAVKSA